MTTTIWNESEGVKINQKEKGFKEGRLSMKQEAEEGMQKLFRTLATEKSSNENGGPSFG